MRPEASESLSCPPAKELVDYLTNLPELKYADLPEFELIPWEDPIDSSEMTAQHWSRLSRDIRDNFDRCDGFVIVCGTDTLAYSSSILSFMLENLSKPVVLTGAMLPVFHVQTDAKKNLAVSLLVASQPEITEVVVVFGSRIMRGCRCRKLDCLNMDAFDTPNCSPLGRIGIKVEVEERNLLDPPPEGSEFRICEEIAVDSVILLTMTPHFEFRILEHLVSLPKRPLGVILQLFGTGTAPSTFTDALRHLIKHGITIVAVTQCFRGTCSLRTYLNGEKLHRMGVIEGGDMTPEAAVAKLAYLFSKKVDPNSLSQLMETDLRGELTQTKQNNFVTLTSHIKLPAPTVLARRGFYSPKEHIPVDESPSSTPRIIQG